MGVRWRATTCGAKQTKGGVLVTQRILVTDSEGAPLVEHLWSNFHIGGTIDADLGESIADHTFPEEARTRPVGSRTITVDRDQAFRYAGVSGDHAGHALDDETARQEGYPSKILQGMCTFGLCSGAVVDEGAGRNAIRLRRLAGRFSAPAFPGRDLVVNLYDAGRTSEGGHALAFEALQDNVVVIKHGLAEFAT
jgi:acyl dehydratase